MRRLRGGLSSVQNTQGGWSALSEKLPAGDRGLCANSGHCRANRSAGVCSLRHVPERPVAPAAPGAHEGGQTLRVWPPGTTSRFALSTWSGGRYSYGCSLLDC